LRFWDPVSSTATGEPVAEHNGPVWEICSIVTPDGQVWLATSGHDGTVRLWDTTTARSVGNPLTGHVGTVWGVRAVPPQHGVSLLATAGGDGTVRFWDPTAMAPFGAPLTTDPTSIDAVGQTSDAAGRILQVMVGYGPAVQVWNPVTSVKRQWETGGRGSVSAVTDVAGWPGRAAIVTGGTDGVINVFDAATGSTLREPVSTGVDPVLAICALDERMPLVAVAGGDGTIRVWDLIEGLEVRAPLTGHGSVVRALAWLHGRDQPNLLASAGQDGIIRLWDTDAWRPFAAPLDGHAGWVWSLCAISEPGAGGLRLGSTGADGTVRRWDPISGPIGTPMIAHTDQARAICTMSLLDGRILLASGGHDETIRLWNPANGDLIYTIPLGIPIHTMSQQRQPSVSTDAVPAAAATLTAGTGDGVLSIGLHESLFPNLPSVDP
jgi:WD40 repeat protein